MATSTEWFTPTSAYSLAFVASIGVVAWVSAPKNAKSFDRFTWIWMVRAFSNTFMHISLTSCLGLRRPHSFLV